VTGAFRSAAVLAAVFLLLHLPFLPKSLEDHDSINFALGIGDFDVAAHQPHPPGYPLFIALAKIVSSAIPSEARALGVLGSISGALSAFALAVLFRRLTPGAEGESLAIPAVAMTLTTPLLWVNAARPLSDTTGLAAILGAQAFALSVASGPMLVAAAFVIGLVTGLRSQALILCVPLLVVAALNLRRKNRPEALKYALFATGALAVGGLLWFVPLVWLTGGPARYWHAVSDQGAEDLLATAPILWVRHGPRELLAALNATFVSPWGAPALAGAALTLAVIGGAGLLWRSRGTLAILIIGFGPYLVFDLLFQDVETTKYALPLVAPLTFLVARAFAMMRPSAAVVATALFTIANLLVGVPSLRQYASDEAPALRLFKDMRAATSAGDRPVLAMHRRGELDLRRSLQWWADELPSFSERLPVVRKHEWLELVKYWNRGGRAPVWFIADPLRTDLALIDHREPRRYRWPLTYRSFIGGMRPADMDLYVLNAPAWYLGEGWALTPETAGIADADGRGRGRSTSEGWVRRSTTPVTLMIGGRNLSATGTAASLTVSLDGRVIARPDVAPGFFLTMTTLAPETLAGGGDYAPLTITATGDIAIEQFDAQPSDRVVFGFDTGWQENEFDGASGRSWRWMSERGDLRVRGTGKPLLLTVKGFTEDFSRPSHITVRIGDQTLTQTEVGDAFTFTAPVPASAAAGEFIITIETDQVNIPAERSSDSADRRHLALKVSECYLAEVVE
jgi:hypothetical protein